jgi:acid phosphatase family membrane protein YuiD
MPESGVGSTSLLDIRGGFGETGRVNGVATSSGGDLFDNPVFLSAICSLLLAQFLKAVINILKSRSRSFHDIIVTFFWKTGGMPSSHSALAVSIATAIAFSEGPNTSIFILSLFFALVVVRDAMGVRRAAGQQAKALNAMSKELSSRFDIPHHIVKEVHGHNPTEVLVGGVLGFFIALAFCTL